MFLVVLTALWLHPVHETVAEVEWNPQTHCLEVALRLDALDEQWLRKRMGQDPPVDGLWQRDYLRDKFRIEPSPREGEKDTVVYRWIGREEQRGHVWWFFELHPQDKLPPEWIEQRVLFERETNYVNRVVVLGQVPKRTLILTMQRPRASLIQDDDDESDSQPQAGR